MLLSVLVKLQRPINKQSANWVELEINDWHLELYPGDIIENSAIK